jgi:DNA-binding GntR family transcriptional regulator
MSADAAPYAGLPTLAVEALNERVCQVLRDAIVTGALPPGQRLVEARLAEHLGVSRAPIREALRVLQREGLVTSLPARGVVVTVLTKRDVREIYGLRTALECWAVREACVKASPTQIKQIATLIEEMDQASLRNDADLLAAEDVRFHSLIFEISGNNRLLQVSSTILSQIRLLSTQVVHTLYTDLRLIPDRHHIILDAIRSGDADTAERCVRDHITSVADLIVAAFPDSEPTAIVIQDVNVAAQQDGPRGTNWIFDTH